MTRLRCVDCDRSDGVEPCPECGKPVCEKCFDGTMGMCLACPKRARAMTPRRSFVIGVTAMLAGVFAMPFWLLGVPSDAERLIKEAIAERHRVLRGRITSDLYATPGPFTNMAIDLWQNEEQRLPAQAFADRMADVYECLATR